MDEAGLHSSVSIFTTVLALAFSHPLRRRHPMTHGSKRGVVSAKELLSRRGDGTMSLKASLRFVGFVSRALRLHVSETPNPTVDLTNFGRWTPRDLAAQRRSPLR